MMKQLSLSLALVFAVACKVDGPAPAAGSAAEPPSGKARSAKIDVKPLPPAQPAAQAPAAPEAPAGDEPSLRREGRLDPEAREEWRKRRMARLDKDGDGKISDAERDAAMKERMTEMRARFDTDGDGKVSPAELGSAGRLRLDDPAAVDTNHDGDISADELAAALKSRRDARRAARDAAPTPAAPAPGDERSAQ